MTVTNNYLNKQELVSQKVPGSKAVVLSGFDDKMSPVYGARLLATDITNDAAAVKKNFGSLFVKDNIDSNSTYIRHSGDASFLFDKQNEQIASWAWNTVDISIPDTIKPTLEIIKTMLDPLKDLLAIIKEALTVLASVTIGITEALRILIEEVISTITSALEWFNIEVSLHTLFVPPIVPTQTRDGSSELLKVSESIVKGMASAISLIDTKIGSTILPVAEQSVAGNKGFYNLVTRKLNDRLDTNRPQFRDNNYLAGCVVMFGYPVEELYNIYYRILRVFKLASVPMHAASIKPIVIKEVHYIKSLDKVIVYADDFATNKIVSYNTPSIIYKKRRHYILLSSSSASQSTVATMSLKLESAIKDLAVAKSNSGIPSALYITGDEPNVVVGYTEEFSDNAFDLLEFDIGYALSSGVSYKYAIYSYYNIDEYVVIDGVGKYTDKVVLVQGGQGTLNIPAYGKFQVNYGVGKAPQWVQVSSMFDLFDILGTVRDVLGLVKKYVNGFFSKVANVLKTILEELTKYLNFISYILTKIDTVLDLLKALAGLGVGGSILMFQGEGGNTTFSNILKDSLIDRPAKLYNKSPIDTSRPDLDSMSLAHSSWVESKKNIAKYYSSVSRQFDSLSFSTDTYSYSGSFPPNFSDVESVAGFVMVGGGDSIDNVTKLYNLLKSLLSSDKNSEDSDSDFKTDLLNSLGVDPSAYMPDSSLLNSSYPTSTDINNDFIPGAYTQAMEAAKSPSDMLEDYCNR